MLCQLTSVYLRESTIVWRQVLISIGGGARDDTMSLYHEAAQTLNLASEKGGSVKSIVFGGAWSSNRKSLFALSTETVKWSKILSEIIERSSLLALEKQVRRCLEPIARYVPS